MSEVVGQVEGRTCIVVDDMIDTGSTIIKASEALFAQGASKVIVTNTLPIADDKRFDKLTVLSIAPLVARAINEVFSDGSVTSLFDGNT